MILAPTNKRIIRPYDKPSFEHTQRYGLIKGHPLGPAGGLIFFPIMNEGSGNIHNLAQDYNHETSRVDVTWAAGKFGPCNSFPGGAGDHINCGAVSEQLKLLSTDFTLIVWGNTDTITGDHIFFGAMEADSDGWTWFNDDGKLNLFMDGSTKNSTNVIVVVGEWRQYAITFRVADKQTKFYYNGILDNTDTHPKVPVDTAGRNFVIGVDPRDYSDKRWDGLLDLPMVYNRVLAQSEIALLCREPSCMVQKKAAPVYFFVPIVGGESFMRTIDDDVGVLDSMSRTQAQARTIDDGVGTADSMGRAQVQARTLAEALGLTDAVRKAETKIFADAVGITDAIAKAQGHARTVADGIGMIDSESKLMTHVRTLAEAMGITDAASRVVGFPRTVSDSVGITDSVTKTVAFARVAADAMGITDVVTKTQVQLRTIADAMGLTDEMQPGQLVTFAEAMGMTDAMIHTKTQIRAIADALGITDDLTRVAAYVFTQNDDVGVADAMLRVAVALRTVSDNVGMTDAMSSISGLVKAAWAFMIIRQTHN